MTTIDGTDVRRWVGTRHLDVPSWRIDLAAFGDGSARPVLTTGPATIVLTEAERTRRFSDLTVSRCPRVELQLGSAGTVRVRCHQSPPVLLVRTGTDPAQPLLREGFPAAPEQGSPPRARRGSVARLREVSTAGVHVGADELLFACSPTLLDAMEPAEVLAVPRLLWLSRDPSALLHRWISSAGQDGARGAAAVVARRRTF